MSPRRVFQFGLARHRTAREDMREELQFHIDARIAWLVARGYTADDARAEAVARFGAGFQHAERQLVRSAERKARRLDVRDHISDFIDDTRYALRGLRRSPGFTLVAVLTLAVGIGANTTIYSAVDALLLRSLPFHEPTRLMDIVQTTDLRGTAPWSFPRYRFFRENAHSYTTMAVYSVRPRTLSGPEPERIQVEEVTAEYLTTLGITPARGRDFPATIDAVPGGAPRVALISDALWQRRFGADPNVAGQSIVLENEPWEIVGVLPAGFRGLSGRADALVNLTGRPAESLAEEWSLEFTLVGRVRDDVDPARASAEAREVGARIHEAFPPQAGTLTTSTAPERWSADARTLNTIRVSSGVRRSMLVLFGAVALVLLIACVNLANLLVARAMARRQEIAVRLAIGASRGRLVRLLVTESVVLASLGGALSLVLAYAGTRALSAINPQETLRVQGLSGGVGSVGFETIQLDMRALAFTALATITVSLLFGLLPAWRASRADLSHDLRDGSAGAGTGLGLGAARRSLVVAQVALAIVLLAGSGLMIRSLDKLLGIDPGFDGRNVLTLRLTVPPGVVAPDSMPGFYEGLERAIAAVPGVEHVGLLDCPPLAGGCNGTIMTFADRAQSATGNAMVGVHWSSPGWFSALQVPLRRGRIFTDGDRIGTPKVVLINEEAARRYFPGEDPIGKRVAVYQGGFNTGAEVVGIVGDVRFGTIDSLARPDVYIAYGQSRVPRLMVFVRTVGDPSALAPHVRAAARSYAPFAPIFDMQTMVQRMGSATAQARFSAVLLGMFAAIALTVAMIGVYGVMAFAVAARTREIGIRMALGAAPARVLALVMREGALLAGLGLTIGVVAALGATRALRTQLFEVSTADPVTYVTMATLLGVALAAACWIPARRAARVDPLLAMRAE